MSDAIEEEYDDFAPRRSRRARILLFTVFGVIVAFFLVTLFASIYTDRLWFASVGYTGVYDKILWTRIGLFFGFGLVMALAIAANIVIAYRARPFHRPDSPEQTGLDRYRDAVAPIRVLLLVSVSGVIGLFGGVAAIGRWRTFLLWANREPFHTTDPYFHKDAGFYIFTLPWLHFLAGFAIAVMVLSAVAALVVHYLYGGIRLQATAERMSATATTQLSVIGGLALLAKAFGYWLDRFDLVIGSGGVVTGMDYTDQHAVLPARDILVGVALVCAVLFFVTAWRRAWLLPGVGIGLLVVTSILLGLIWPAFVQHFQVNPNRQSKEAAYIQKNIEATQQAYGLNDFKVVQEGTPPATAASVQQLIDETSSVPVVDPSLIAKAFDQTQSGYGYYQVTSPLDVDHYPIDGVDRAVVIGARELDQSGINAADQNWLNLHTIYTHGSGVIAAFGNQRPVDNRAESQQIQWAQGQDPGENALEKSTGPFQQRIYFGPANQASYAIVGKSPGAKSSEIDFTAAGGQSRTTYAGGGGVSVGGFFNKLMYAIKFGDSNFLLSGSVGSHSKVLYYRDPTQRVEKVAPWLTLDGDVYPVVSGGRILWVLDGYTTADNYPQSERDSFSAMTADITTAQGAGTVRTLPTDQINYLRDAVKATVDAYTGKVTLYAWDESDPILQAWRSAFPGTVLDRSQIPSALLPHLRYPADMFKVQRYQYARYHVGNANDFFNANQQWQISPDAVSRDGNQVPIRMFAPDPATGQQTWSLTSSYVFNNKTNLAGFVTANSDPTSSDYGTVYVEQPGSENLPGPAQAYSQLVSDPRISQKVQSFRLGNATTRYGNVVSVPLSSGMMYVVPVYATRQQTSTSSYETLRYVMVSYGSRAGIGSTLVKAITDMTGSSPPPSGGHGHNSGKGNGGNSGGQHQSNAIAKAHALLVKAQDDFAAANRAFQQGDFAQYVRLNHEARVAVARALNLLG